MAKFLQNHPELRMFLLQNVRLTGRIIGVGSFGSVEEGGMPGGRCAVKQLHDVLQARDVPEHEIQIIVGQFVEECRLMSTLRHPYIVQFLGICLLPGSRCPALVTEILETDLERLLESHPNIPLSLKHSFLSNIAGGIAYLHGHNPPILHRDISARNIYLDSGMVAKIGDFGRACTLPSLRDDPLQMPGAQYCMPPEAMGNYDLPLDIFTLGVVALFTLTQQIPVNVLPPIHEDHGMVIYRTALGQREEYMQLLYRQLHQDHPLVLMIKRCLGNNPRIRPTIWKVMQILEKARAECYDEDCYMDKLQLIQTGKEWKREKDHLAQTVVEKNEMIDNLFMKNAKLIQDRKKNLAFSLQEKEGELYHCKQKINDLHAQLQEMEDQNWSQPVNDRDYHGVEENCCVDPYGVLDREPDMKTLLSEVAAPSRNPNWESIGYALGLGEPVINRVRKDTTSIMDGFMHTFEEWKKKDPQPTWRKLLSALRSRHVCQEEIADNLQHKLLESKPEERSKCISLQGKNHNWSMKDASNDLNGILERKPDMKTLLNEVAALSKTPNWECIGYALGVGEAVINRIRRERLDSLDGFVRMFEEWMNTDSQQTWRKILNALQMEHVGEHALAYNLRHKLLESARV